jgi:hypothetical protein
MSYSTLNNHRATNWMGWHNLRSWAEEGGKSVVGEDIPIVLSCEWLVI